MSERRKVAIDFGGDPRGGKGTSVGSIGETYSNVAIDETGADYRALTKGFVVEGVIEPGQTKEEVRSALAHIGVSGFYDMAKRKQEIIGEFGHGSLYESEINSTVSSVAPIEEVRQAIKAAFKQRVRDMIKSDEHDILVVDGRNLGPVIDSVDGIDLLMQVYMSCSAEEAARRECLRKGINPDEDLEAFKKAHMEVEKRKQDDRNREIDSVAPSPNAIDYWFDPQLLDQTLTQLEQAANLSSKIIDYRPLVDPKSYTRTQRVGAGALAVTSRRQLLLDTSDYRGQHKDPRQAMLNTVHTIFEEAIETNKLELLASK